MKCPHCRSELSEGWGVEDCPCCGKCLRSEPVPTGIVPARKIKWRLFLAGMLLPPILTLLSAVAMHRIFLQKPLNEGVSPIVAVVASGAGGILCGVLLGIRAGSSIGARVGISIVMSAVMVVVCIVLSFFGCGIGGYDFRIN
jgi:hypothetical protein